MFDDHPQLHRFAGHVATADRLAPIAGRRPADPSGSMASRVWSRIRAAAALLLTSRQKRFNLEVTTAVAELGRITAALMAEVTAARAEFAVARAGLTRVEGMIGPELHALTSRVTHVEQYAFALREVVDALRDAQDREAADPRAFPLRRVS